ncbi:hypothetical protein [Thermoplasma sp.]|uniref:hypothetical protein n=1 Tax=Thermoplasma sp. TaxID=1973142 RepID=UPI00127345AF|nr:hypothetical protein [Thermoplasma sp.]KAA8922016.1 MAG: hypothetical protein F6Q11_06575 [Thermoplasma sp.]
MKPYTIIEYPEHRPFTISSNRGYFIGYLDLVPDGMGYHKKGEMNGLWYPPLRALKNVYVSDGERILKPIRAEIGYNKTKFLFDGSDLDISFDDGSVFTAMLTNRTQESRVLVIELLPETVWYSINDTRVIPKKRTVTVYSYMFPEVSLRIRSTADLSIEGSRLTIHSNRRTSVRVWANSIISGEQHMKMNGYADIDRFSVLISRDRYLSRNFRLAKDNMIRLSLMVPGIGYGIMAGHPDFPWFFGIDTLLSINGMLDSGLFDLAFGSLNVLARFSRSGKIPHEVLTSGKVYNDGDLEETAMFPYAVFRYARWTGHDEKVKHLVQTASESFDYLFNSGYRGRGIMEDPDAGTGVDIDTVSFTIMSLKEFEKMMTLDQHIVGEIADRIRPREKIGDLMKLLRSFWMPEKNTFANRIVDRVPFDLGFWTSIVPFYAGLPDPELYGRFVSDQGGLSRLSSIYGIRVDANGNSMPINTGMFVLGAIRYGDIERASEYFRKLNASLGSFSPNSYPEIINNPQGCYLQAWSAAIYLESVVEGFFGVHPEGDRIVSIPHSADVIPSDTRIRNLIFRDGSYEFKL